MQKLFQFFVSPGSCDAPCRTFLARIDIVQRTEPRSNYVYNRV